MTLDEIVRRFLQRISSAWSRVAGLVRRRDEVALRWERHARMLLEAAPDAMVIVDSRGHIVLVNAQAERMFGYEGKKIAGQPIGELIPERFGPTHDHHVEAFLRDAQVRPMGEGRQLLGRRRDGSEFPVEISLAPLETEDGLLVSAAVRDITDRVRAEQRFRDLLEAAPDAMVIVDETGTITLANAQAEKLFGFAREELLGSSVDRLVPERFRGGHEGKRAGFLDSPSARPMGSDLELFAVRKDGTEFPVEISLSPLKTEQGLLVSAAVRDITGRKRAQDQLAEYTRSIEEANEELKEFAYVASHDLSEPLRTISGFVQLLQSRYEGKLDDDADEFIGFVVQGTERMQKLIEDLLIYSRVGRTALELEPIEVGGLLDRVEAGLARALQESGGEVVRGELPTVEADAGQLDRLFANLVSNSLKFRAEDEAPRIEISAEPDGPDRWAFTIRDNGIGIEPRHAERIFRVFQRLHSTDDYPGTGIGLSICKKIVERHGGTIWARPGSSRGAEMHFTLPAHGGTGTSSRSAVEVEHQRQAAAAEDSSTRTAAAAAPAARAAGGGEAQSTEAGAAGPEL